MSSVIDTLLEDLNEENLMETIPTLQDQCCINITVKPIPVPTTIECTSITTDKNEYTEGDAIHVSATFSASGGNTASTATYDIFINGVQQNMQKSMTLNPGDSIGYSWELTAPDVTTQQTLEICVRRIS